MTKLTAFQIQKKMTFSVGMYNNVGIRKYFAATIYTNYKLEL